MKSEYNPITARHELLINAGKGCFLVLRGRDLIYHDISYDVACSSYYVGNCRFSSLGEFQCFVQPELNFKNPQVLPPSEVVPPVEDVRDIVRRELERERRLRGYTAGALPGEEDFGSEDDFDEEDDFAVDDFPPQIQLPAAPDVSLDKLSTDDTTSSVAPLNESVSDEKDNV